MEISKLHVYSEIGKLRTVLLHKPSRELENLTPDIMKRLLFDDIPDFVRAGEEYDAYLDIFKNAGVQTIFVEDLLADTLDQAHCREDFLEQYLGSGTTYSARQLDKLKRHFLDYADSHKMVDALIRGLRKEEAPDRDIALFEDLGGKDNPLILDPLPNLYFTRDPFIVLGNGVSISSMFYPARRRETIIAETIFRRHPDFAGKIPLYSRNEADSYIEGGDILILGENVIAIGLSQRTSQTAITRLAEELLQAGGDRRLEHVLAFKIPSTRAFMHLDTVFTQLDRDLFVVHPGITKTLEVTDIRLENGQVFSEDLEGSLEDILQRFLGLEKVRLIPCGGGSPIDAQREQWNDGSNTLALAPGEIIVYDRNRVTNRLFEEVGLTLHKLPSSEISRGRGGPHCMSMPFYRDFLD